MVEFEERKNGFRGCRGGEVVFDKLGGVGG